MSNGEQQTAVSDSSHNLTSVFSHAAEGGYLYAKYIRDAEQEGDNELATSSGRSSGKKSSGAQQTKPLCRSQFHLSWRTATSHRCHAQPSRSAAE